MLLIPFQMTCTGLLVMLFCKTSNRKSCLVSPAPTWEMTGDDVNIGFFFSGEILRLFLSAVRLAVCGGHRHHDRRPYEQVEGEGGRWFQGWLAVP